MANRSTPRTTHTRNIFNRALSYVAARLTIKLLGGLAVAGAAVAGYFYYPFVHHQVTIQLISRHSRPTIGIPITLVLEEHKDSLILRTDGNGRCMFTGRHRLTRWYSHLLGDSANRQFMLDKDTVLVFSVDKLAKKIKPGIPPIIPDQPHKDPRQSMCKILIPTRIIPWEDQVKNTDTARSGQELSPNEILEKLSLMVKVDPGDHYAKRNDLIAYHYYLSGDQNALSKIRRALYRRDGANFPEAQADRFILCDWRGTCFEYIGYQSVEVYNAYVQIQLVNGQRSAIFQKQIVYPSPPFAL